MKRDITSLILKQRQRNAELTKRNEAMDSLLGIKDEWNLEHEDKKCPKCKTHNLSIFKGVYKGENALKSECTNKDCNYVNIESLDDSED